MTAFRSPVDKLVNLADVNTTGAVDGQTLQKSGLTWLPASVVSSSNLAINVKAAAYGAKGDGVTDDTAAINAAAAAAIQSFASTPLPVRGPAIYFPFGKYVYNGTGIDPSATAVLHIIGEGREGTVIQLGATSYLMNTASGMHQLTLRNIGTRGGKGVILMTNTATNTLGQYIVENCDFYDYTEACISHNSSDMPYWRIRNNLFRGANTTGTMAVALAGFSDNCVIEANGFQNNRVGLKLGVGGNSARVEGNDFIRYDTTTTYPRIDIWVVPAATYVNSGRGCAFIDNKFGNENVAGTDYMIVYADEGAGAGFGTKFPNLAADSVGFVVGHIINQNAIIGSATRRRPIVYTTTPNVRDVDVSGNVISGAAPTYTLEYRTAPAADARNTGNLLGPNRFNELPDYAPTTWRTSNGKGAGFTPDPACHFAAQDETLHGYTGGADWGSYVELPTVVTINDGILGGGATKTQIADAYGGNDAAEVTLPNSGDISVYILAANITAGQPVWLEFDVKAGAASPLAELYLDVRQFGSGTETHLVRRVAVSTRWRRYRFLYWPRSVNGDTYVRFYNSTGSSGQVKIGKPRVYHAREPMPVAPPSNAYATVASAAAITIPDAAVLVRITGTTAITSMNVTYAGHEVALVFADVLTFTDGSNLKLAGNFATTADDTITLACDGTNWFEKARSVN